MEFFKQLASLSLLLLLVVSATPAASAEPTIRGKVLEKGSRRALDGITVYLQEKDTVSSFSEADGSFTLHPEKAGAYLIKAAGIGFTDTPPLKATTDSEEIIIYMEPVYSLMEVVVQGERNQDKASKIVITGKELASVPGSMGDPLRAMQALPGITTASDTSSNPAIRGSGPDDNFYYVDFAPVGYLFHMGGLESVINPDLVDDFNIYASSFGPEFTDVTGGIIDVKLRDPRKDRLGGKLNVSMLETDALLEGPLTKDQSFYLAARRSYIDLFLPKSGKMGDGVEYRQFPNYYDYQGKYLWEISPDHTLTIHGSGAKDQLKFTLTNEAEAVQHDPILAGDLNAAMAYHSQAVQLNSRLAPKLANMLGLAHQNTSMTQIMTQLGHVKVNSDQFFLRDQLSALVAVDHELLFGVEAGSGRIKLDLDMPKTMPSDFVADTDYTSAARFLFQDTIATSFVDLALKDRWRIHDQVTLIAGGHGSYESYFGKYRLEPRLSTEIKAAQDTLVTAGWGKYHQFPEGPQVIEGMGNPKLSYITADHYSIGVEQQLPDGWSAKIEGYYKVLDNIVIPQQPENYSNGGSGKAYGSELLIKKSRNSNWSGWLSATYSRTERHNDVTGEKFPYRYDQPLVMNLVYQWHITPVWTLGAKWRYQTGAPFTPVTGTYTDATGRIRPVYDQLGSERLPDYHRLDLRITRDFLFNNWKMGVYLDIINAYARENVSGYQYNGDYSSRKPVKQLPLLPAFGVRGEF
jgi:hypothetical protein